MNFKAKLAFSIIVSASLLTTMQSASADSDKKKNLLQEYSKLNARSGGSGGQFSIIGSLFTMLDRDSNGISQSELTLAQAIEDARMRAQFASQILALDLDGDLSVTRDEYSSAMNFQTGRQRQSAEVSAAASKRLDEHVSKKFLENDVDGDGTLSGAELYSGFEEANQQQGNFGRQSGYSLAKAMLELDPDGDGLLTEAEALLLVAEVGKQFAMSPLSKLPREQLASGCQSIQVTSSSKLYLVQGYEGLSLSSVAITRQQNETSAVTVNIEDGTEKLIVALSTYEGTIWHFTGKVERVEKVIAVSDKRGTKPGTTAVGIVGVPKEKIEYLNRPNCMPSSDYKSTGMSKSIAQLTFMTGLEVSGFVGDYSLGQIDLPSGKNNKRRLETDQVIASIRDWAKAQDDNSYAKLLPDVETSDARVAAEELLRFNKLGLSIFDPKSVETQNSAEEYTVLPQQAGLLQLLLAGKISRKSGANQLPIYNVHDQIIYPGGLNGAHSVTFIVDDGVPLPEGHPAHSCALASDEQTVLNGAVCGHRIKQRKLQ